MEWSEGPELFSFENKSTLKRGRNLCKKQSHTVFPKRAVIAAYERVKVNKGTYGVDEQSIEDFEEEAE